MNRTFRNFWLDVFLFLLLGLDIALVSLARREPSGGNPGFVWHVHIAISVLLTLGCLVHIGLHWQWFQAVLSGKAKGRMSLVMNSMVIAMMLAANVSGHEVLTSGTASRLHNLTGTFALIGMSVHGVKHTHWMAAVAKRLGTGGQKNTIPSA